MDPRHLFVDQRLAGMCVYCGAQPDTRDHVSSKVLLDKPYPPQLPVVGACERCNASFSLDEQYLACFLECVICGGTGNDCLGRPSVKRILDGNPALKRRIEGARKKDKAGKLLWNSEVDRIRNVAMKLARGHAAYELCPQIDRPVEVGFVPLEVLSEEERSTFEQPACGELVSWPEIGSRSFLRACGKFPEPVRTPR